MSGETHRKYVEGRRRLVARWNVVGWSLIAAIAAVLGFLFLTSPLLVNPFEVLARVGTGSLPAPTLDLMAVMLPVVFLGCIMLLVVLVIFQFAAIANERRLIAIIDDLLRHGETGSENQDLDQR
jgi:hypothetical protein